MIIILKDFLILPVIDYQERGFYYEKSYYFSQRTVQELCT